MKLQKRNCGMEMKLVPYGAGWTDVYFNIGEDKLYFIISSALGEQFSKLLEILYYLHPGQIDPQDGACVEYWDGICKKNDDTYKIINIVEHCEEFPAVVHYCSLICRKFNKQAHLQTTS